MILLIDSYDSFSNNLRRLIERETKDQVIVVQNDFIGPQEYETCFKDWISKFDYIVIGPGPGNPANNLDVGVISWLFNYFKSHPDECIPVLGVCLGFQSLCYAFGNDIKELDQVRHGQMFTIVPKACNIFGDNPVPFESVRYHSLGISVDDLNGEIIPLATCQDPPMQIVMAGCHRNLPLYGVQYHPESICSEKGDELVRQFHQAAHTFNRSHNRPLCQKSAGFSLDIPHISKVCEDLQEEDKVSLLVYGLQIELGDRAVSPVDLSDSLRKVGQDIFLLNSASDPGDWSIIGLPIAGHSEVITHSLDCPNIVRINKHSELASSEIAVSSVWDYLKQRMQRHIISRVDAERKFSHLTKRPSPFYGGFIGLISYEEGQYVKHADYDSLCEGPTPDVKLIFIERFLLYDHATLEWALLSIKPNDESWVCSFEALIQGLDILKLSESNVPASVKDFCGDHDAAKLDFDFPDRNIYGKQFKACQDYLHSGDSYELCLTTQLKVRVPSHIDPWDMYKILTLHKNPSPYSSFMCFDDCVLLSSSPERFLSWKNETAESDSKYVELRPIKGTVRNDGVVTMTEAEALLKTPKEMGENLMIVDLIRHDLDPFVSDVNVTSLMSVERYKTVYQLVSVIGGSIRKSSGLDVLSQSLPPGSMTGAPKKRSIQLLEEIESLQISSNNGRRGIYSGVAGYWSITDEADWSVTIRSMYHYKNDRDNSTTHNIWRIGAGGAITVLSEEEAEWDEMKLKLLSTLQIFR